MRIVINKKDKILYLTIDGDFCIGNVVSFEDQWEKITEAGPEVIAVNCRDIVFIDSTALGTLVQFMKFLMNKKIQLVFFDLSIAVDTLFKATQLNRFFKITTIEKLELDYK